MSGERFDDDTDDVKLFWHWDVLADKLLHPINVTILAFMPFLQHMPGPLGNTSREFEKTQNKIYDIFYYKMKVIAIIVLFC